MIVCQVNQQDNKIIEIIVTGHANYAESGEDIICSAASMLCYTIANKCLSLSTEFEFFEDSKKGMKFTNKGNSNEVDLLLDTLVEGFELLVIEYPKYVALNR